ncbi:hypothetical protein [Thermoflexus sp.]|uniref:hypothetical protein n=1 Tax=Thermoflexus sp. TaxID=1969742 RepID=UPI002ADDE7B6|nr:hypothetical protein [Thermoflexus sp.]
MVRRWMRGSRGVQTLEWVALALVVLALIGAVTAWMNGPGGVQVAAPIQQALQRYAWCLEGAGGCPGAGGGNAFGANPPGVRPPGGNPPGANPPGGNPPGVNPPGGKPPDPVWCVTHPGDCLSNFGKWAADKWEDVKRGAGQAWEGLKSTAEGVWKWLDEHKGIVAGVVVAGLLILGSILLTGGVALPIWLAAGGAVLFGGLYQLSSPKAGLQGWLEAFGLAGMGAIAVPLLAQGISAMAASGLSGILRLFVSKGIIGGVSSALSYIILTPPNEWSIQGLAIAFGAGVLTEMPTVPSAKAALAAILGTIEAARRKELSLATPIRSFGQSLLLDEHGGKAYNRGFGRVVGKGIGWLRGKGISISSPNFMMRVLNRVSWDIIKIKLFGM